MDKPRGRHAKPKPRNVGPLYAVEAAIAQIYALREGHAAMVRQAGGDVICEKCPAADAAFEAWAESDDSNPATAVEVILAAIPS